MLAFFSKLILLVVLSITSSAHVLCGENAIDSKFPQNTCTAEPLTLIQEEPSGILEEASPLFILTSI